jgi:hypothetical protein
MNICNFQISQCRIKVDVVKTTEFYSEQNLIVDDCDCKDCKHFAENVIKKEIRIFEILKKMGVDLAKNENNQPDGLWHTGEGDKFKNSYIHYYRIFGTIGKTQLSTTKINNKGLKSVEYFANESDSFCRYIFSQINNEEIECQINLECDRK